MKIRLNKLLILLLFPVHLLLLWYMQDMPGQTGFLLLVLLVLAADFVLSFLQTEIFSAKNISKTTISSSIKMDLCTIQTTLQRHSES